MREGPGARRRVQTPRLAMCMTRIRRVVRLASDPIGYSWGVTRVLRPVLVTALSVVALVCGGFHSGTQAAQPISPWTSGSSSVARSGAPASSARSSASRGGASKLLVFMVENHSLAEMRTHMPWTHRLAKSYAYATDYHAMTHPSLPNYLAIAGGSTFGINDDNNPSSHPLHGHSVFGLARRAGLSARVYAESMPGPCTTVPAGEYAVKHNPWAYFVAERSQCRSFDTPMTRFARDVHRGHLPAAGMVVPNICHDAHDCSLATADAWLKKEVGLAMAGPDFQHGRLAIVITADEDDGSQGNTVLTTVVDPSVRGVVARTPLTHLSLCRLYTQVLGLSPLRQARHAPSMAKAFGLPLARH
jgi:phosphatidylinositol-3-phosphatase